MSRLRLLLPIAFAAALLASPAAAQNVMSTFAGGGPNNINATAANLNGPVGIAKDLAGNTYIAVQSANRVFKVDTSGVLTVFAGSGAPGFTGDNVPATDAALNQPNAVAADSNGNIYIADTGNNRIRRVDAVTGIISTFAGTGAGSFSGDGGPATSASINSPTGVAVDSLNNVYIADRNNRRIRIVTAGTITTFAGNGNPGFFGDGGPATSASLNNPTGIALDAAGNLFIADTFNHRIRRVDALAPNNISTVAGNGSATFSGDNGPATAAGLSSPLAVALNNANEIFIADRDNQRIRRVSAGTITTYAGNGTEGFSGDNGAATAAQLDTPTGVATDPAGNVFLADFGNNRIRVVEPVLQRISTFAGNGFTSFGGDGSPAAGATLQNPSGVAIDANGHIFIADRANHRIRRVDAVTGIITTVAGNGTPGFSGDAGLATAAQLNSPNSVAVDSTGALYISDTANHRIRRVAAGIITTYAGSGATGPGGGGFSGDNGPATAALLNSPTGIAFDSTNNLFIADTANSRIRRVAAAAPNNITTFAGNGTQAFSGDGAAATAAGINRPQGVGIDSTGRLLIADTNNNRVRRVEAAAPFNISTVAGNGNAGFAGDGGAATSTSVSAPLDVITDSSDNLFITDSGNQRIRFVAAASGNINTIAGNGTFGFSGDGGPAILASIASPAGIALDEDDNLLIADVANHRIRLATTGSDAPFVLISPSSVAFGTQIQGTTSAPRAVILTNIGSASLTVNSIAITGPNASDFAQTTTPANACGGAVAGSASCTINVTFTPSASGDRSATLVVTDNAAGSPRNIPLTGSATPPAPGISLSRTTVVFGQQVFGSSSATQTVTLTNSGSQTLTINGITLTGANASEFSQTNTCGTSVANGANCVITLTFTPASTGGRQAQVNIASNAAGSPHTINLTGTGVDFTVAASPATITVDAGSEADYSITLIGSSGFSGQVTLTCSGTPNASSCAITPNVVTLGSAATTVQMKITTTARTAIPPQSPAPRHLLPPVLLALFTFALLLLLARHRNTLVSSRAQRLLRPVAAFSIVIVLAAVLVACGGGGNGGNGTPAGSSTITVTGTATNVARTSTVTLVVR